MNPDLAEIPGAFQLPLLDWNVIRLWLEEHVPEADRSKAWASIATQWLQKLNESLSHAYQVSQSRHLLLFAPRDSEMAEPLLDFGESGLAEIDDALGALASESQPGPIVVLLFADNATYGRFVSPFDWEFEYIRSAGVFLKGTYPQIALRQQPIDSLQKTLLHEITHACLAHLTLPQWVEEGMTQLAEEAVGPHWARFTLDATRANEIKSYWREHGLSDFWWGKGFRLYDEGQSHSYELAQILFRVIAADYRRRLPDFVRHAHADDAGESAAREFLGRDLADFARQFLGPGDWGPVPPDAPSYCRRGVLMSSRGLYDKAIADFDEGIRLDSLCPDIYTLRGNAVYLRGDYSAAITDFTQAIKVNPRDHDAHNNLAWILATCPSDELRNGEKAVEHSEKACELSAFGAWYFVGTLAATYAEVGDFEEACRWAKESLRLAPEEERPACKERLKLYKSGQPYRETVTMM
ncbi:MAG: tetratricopeptide repeat protein [Planctomycetes bacterium]|nr:tetratricopeptide repeat protein [Planctomycetota bacterium]